MELLKKVGNILVNVLIILVFICLLFAFYNFWQLKILKKAYTNYFGYTYFEVLTGSMEDEIRVNDYVFVKIDSSFKEEDIISYINDDEVITHRIVELNKDRIVTKGDNNNAVDDAINISQVIGKVVYVGRGYGKYIKIITEPIVFIPFLCTVIFLNLGLSSKKR